MIEFNIFGILIVVFSIIAEIILLKKKKIEGIGILAYCIFVIYLVMLVKITLFPIPFENTAITLMKEMNEEYSYNFIPMHSISEIIRTYDKSIIFTQLMGNLILLFPMGFYFGIVSSKLKPINIIGMIIGISVLIELIQFLIGIGINFRYRMVDIDDVLLNVIGGSIGALMGILLRPLYKKICGKILNNN